MARNALMAGIGALSLAVLIGTALDAYRIVSVLAAVLIVAAVAVGAAERPDTAFALWPYRGLLAGLLLTFLLGLAGIWLFYTPGQSEYTFVFGVPASTLSYLIFIWILPLFGALYYSYLFPAVGGEAVVEEIMTEARTRQAEDDREYPLTAERTRSDRESER
jgi:hypothetical protein